MKKKAVIYARVSSTGERQSTERQVLDIIDDLKKAGVNIYFQDHNMSTLLPDGKPNEITTLLVSLMGTFAQIEREQIAYRLNSGQKRAIENGVKMRRKEAFFRREWSRPMKVLLPNHLQVFSII